MAEELRVAIIIHGVVQCILKAIKVNGLEKTLEDLRSRCDSFDTLPTFTEQFLELYESFLAILELGNEIDKKLRRHYGKPSIEK